MNEKFNCEILQKTLDRVQNQLQNNEAYLNAISADIKLLEEVLSRSTKNAYVDILPEDAEKLKSYFGKSDAPNLKLGWINNRITICEFNFKEQMINSNPLIEAKKIFRIVCYPYLSRLLEECV